MPSLKRRPTNIESDSHDSEPSRKGTVGAESNSVTPLHGSVSRMRLVYLVGLRY